MRDIIWTLIIVWLIYKVIDIFRAIPAKKLSDRQDQDGNTSGHTFSTPERDLKSAAKKRANNEGEYVDFEEIK